VPVAVCVILPVPRCRKQSMAACLCQSMTPREPDQ